MILAILLTAALLLLVLVLSSLILGRASSALHPLPRDYALWLAGAISDLLTAPSLDESHFLLSLTPNRAERVALTRVVCSVARNIVECEPRSVSHLSQCWRLEEAMVWRILHHSGRSRREALEQLLWLHPCKESVRAVTVRTFPSPADSLLQLLLVVYVHPERTEELVARHRHSLSWEDVGRIVEVLRMHSLPLSELHAEESENVALLRLRMAVVEGVGDACALAKLFSCSSARVVREAALNSLLEISLFPTAEQTALGG